jgi:hypothetical protein
MWPLIITGVSLAWFLPKIRRDSRILRRWDQEGVPTLLTPIHSQGIAWRVER